MLVKYLYKLEVTVQRTGAVQTRSLETKHYFIYISHELERLSFSTVDDAGAFSP